MRAISYLTGASLAVILFCAGCATSPEVEARREQQAADIEAILAQPLDPAVYGETRRCLSDHEIRSFRALDDRHVLFVGRRDKSWISKLPTRCIDMNFGSTLLVDSFTWSRICAHDQFYVGEWFDWPWYRRWPWRWGGSWGMAVPCTLGDFQPVTAEQVAEIDAVLDRR